MDKDACSQVDPYHQARLIAISYIGISQKSSGKVMTRLLMKDVNREVAQDVISDLRRDGYIDDLRVARSIIRQRECGTAESRDRLCQRLAAAGIPDETIIECRDILLTDLESIQSLTDARIVPDLIKKMDDESFDPNIWMNKSARFLFSRGYNRELVFHALHDALDKVK